MGEEEEPGAAGGDDDVAVTAGPSSGASHKESAMSLLLGNDYSADDATDPQLEVREIPPVEEFPPAVANIRDEAGDQGSSSDVCMKVRITQVQAKEKAKQAEYKFQLELRKMELDAEYRVKQLEIEGQVALARAGQITSQSSFANTSSD
ncbi:hypothetical protein DPEC_G00295390 [Dallia pectoralis]|uniref:Uncharacterized protein n=1 Tax=Dallia pectoralis TaxID=75939 RepID=A0ACC2FIR5_DALPE|nr:hypothetical protein DPEC_G00295390 [Dallia pectoralis]